MGIKIVMTTKYVIRANEKEVANSNTESETTETFDQIYALSFPSIRCSIKKKIPQKRITSYY